MGSAPDSSEDVIFPKQVPEGYCDLIPSKGMGIGQFYFRFGILDFRLKSNPKSKI